jgi:hypothetical protein
MTLGNRLSFMHRSNEDGTVDSICKTCFATVATERSEAALERYESKHVCDSHRLERLRPQRDWLIPKSDDSAA